MEVQKKNKVDSQTADEGEAPFDMEGAQEKSPSANGEKTESRREVSTIAFSYLPLEDAEEGAKAIYSEAGTASITLPQAAAAMGMSNTSSGFRGRLAAMKLFGLMEYDQGRVQLTDLGRAISDPHAALAARVDAFLHVPLYEKYAQIHDGHLLPKGPALEAEFISFGVSSKQADRARQVFDRSAKHAGFVKAGTNRFVRPIIGARANSGMSDESQKPNEVQQTKDVRSGGPNSSGGGNDRDPVIDALVQKIPPTNAPWGVDEQVMWLRMMAMAFGMAYGGKRPITIQAAAETDINRSSTTS